MEKLSFPKKLNKIFQSFLIECNKRKIAIDNEKMAHDFIYLMMLDRKLGYNLEFLTPCLVQNIVNEAIRKFIDPLNPVIMTFKLKYSFQRHNELNLEFVKQKYTQEFENRLEQLITAVLRYPQTSNQEQLKQLTTQIIIFIISVYKIGSPMDALLLKKTKQSLDSVIGKNELHDYVMKVRFNRLEYLQRLSATVCGIIIYNSLDPRDDKGHVRNLAADLEMAQKNTKEAIEAIKNRISAHTATALKIMEDNIEVIGNEKRCRIKLDPIKLHRLNRFIVFYELFQRYMKQIEEAYDKVEFRIIDTNRKTKCVIEKINEILKFRTAIQSELIFPHFAYLSELWLQQVMYLNSLIEMNKIRDEMESFNTEKFERRFLEVMEIIKIGYEPNNVQINATFHELFQNKTNPQLDVYKLKNYTMNYCTLTMSLTDGLLVPAKLARKQCEEMDIQFGYRDVPAAKYTLRRFNEFFSSFKHAIVNNRSLILLFDLEDIILEDVNNEIEIIRAKQQATQTEMVIENDLSVRNRINVTWNIWDYHRETIHLADIRKRQTHSTQSVVSYGQRNAQNQCYYTRKHIGI